MIEPNKTTLVIGAGAHVPYGFPTGEQLLERIKQMHPGYPRAGLSPVEYQRIEQSNAFLQNQITNEVIARKIIKAPHEGYDKNQLKNDVYAKLCEFINDLGESGVHSIDTFLAQYIAEKKDEDYAQIGKLIIAFLILDFEKNKNIAFLKHDWIHFIIKSFFMDKEKLDAFLENPPNIVTFNYDNLFERIIIGNLKKFHGYTDELCKEAIAKINIKHVYGDVGSAFLPHLTDQLTYALENIRVIGEERNKAQNDQEIATIRKSIEATPTVIFLGFGFDRQNLNLLFPKISRKHFEDHVTCYSTNINLSQFSINQINAENGFYISFGHEAEHGKISCTTLLTEKVTLFEDPDVGVNDFYNEPLDVEDDY